MIWWRTLWGGFRKGSGSSGKLTMGVRQVGNSEIESSVCGTGTAYAYDLAGRRTGVSGSGASLTRYNFPNAQSAGNVLSSWSGSINFQPLPWAGTTVTKSPGSPPVV